MRNFFINSLEMLAAVIAVLGLIAVVVGGFGVMFSAQGGFGAGLLFLIGGFIYLVMMVGFLYLVLGIHDNTRRTAEAVERLANN